MRLIAATTLLFLCAHSAAAQSLADQLDAYIRHRPGAPYNGVIAIARGDSTLVMRAYGVADADLGVPNTPELRFGIGSLTKPITATAVLRLVERGELGVNHSICKYLGRCPPSWRGVTLEHLLSHTSGIPDLFNELPAAPVDSTRAVIDATIERRMTDTLRSSPGVRYSYSNFGYFLVGYAMEVATDSSWESVLRIEVFDRAGMHDTEYDDVWRVMPGRVRGYMLSGDSLRHIRYRDHAAYAAGGLLSSATDLLRFARALEDGRLLADSTKRNMFTVRQAEYALGWQITTVFGRRLRNHTGGTNGFSSWIGSFEDGTTVIVLRNVEGATSAKAIGCDVAAIALGLKPSRPDGSQLACRATP